MMDESEMMDDEISESRKFSNNNLEKKPEINMFSQTLIPPHSRNGGLANRGSLFMGLLCTFSVSLFDSFESTTFPVLLSGSDLISSLLDMLPFLLPLSCESLPRVLLVNFAAKSSETVAT
jgi:hypothetical protein